MAETKDAADSSSSTTAAAAAAVEEGTDLLLYSRQHLPADILSMLRLEPLEHLFAFYSELSRHPARLHSKRLKGGAPATAAAAAAGAAAVDGQQRNLSKKTIPASSALLQPSKGALGASAVSGEKVSPSSSKEETAAAAAAAAATEGWVSVGVFVRMLRELGILPGFLSLEAAKTIALVSSTSIQNPQQQQEEEQQHNTEHKKGRLFFAQFVEALVQCLCECTVSNLRRRLQPVHALESINPSSPRISARDAPPAAAAAAAAAAPSLCCSVTQIRDEARQLLDVFGLLSLPSVLALTTRAPD
ncbi:hypothetical protein Emag_004381 [Eimeria magna]